MITIKNSKGAMVNVDERFRDAESGALISHDDFSQVLHKKYNGKLDGYRLLNANGDIAGDSLAYQYATDRLSFIRSKMVEQTFYEVSPADFFQVIPGEGAFAQNIITNVTIKTGSGFNAGKIGTANNGSSLAVANAAVTPKYTYIRNWAMAIEYSIFDVNQAAFAGNWDPIEAKHRARKKDWDLGIQGVAFLGDLDDLDSFPGLYTQPNVNSNLTVITKKISAMSAAEFSTFVAAIIGAYLANANQTVFPNRFVIPQDDWAGLAAPVSEAYPMVSKLEYLQKMFDAIVPGGKVKLMPSAYGMAQYNRAAGVNKARYVLYREDIDTLFMELPVDYQTTATGTLNNFNFQDVAFGQYAGVTVLKELEVLYFDY